MSVTAAVISVVTASIMVLSNLSILVWGAAKLSTTVTMIDKSMQNLIASLEGMEQVVHSLDIRVARLEARADGHDRFLGNSG